MVECCGLIEDVFVLVGTVEDVDVAVVVVVVDGTDVSRMILSIDCVSDCNIRICRRSIDSIGHTDAAMTLGGG